ncbi:MAG: capsular exopolysaccharide family [Bacteroidetes bacterium]|nr:capsular exopolysaccharide family [Bacteroidota bacterium]
MEQSNKNVQDDLLNSLLGSSSSSSTPSKPFTEIVAPYLRNWKWFILSIPVCMAVGFYSVLTTEKLFKSSETILINQNSNKSSNAPSGLNFDDLGLLSSNTNIDNEILTFSSPDLMREVVDTLNLTTRYYTKEGFRDKELFKSSPFVATYSKRKTDFPGQINLTIVKKENAYSIDGQYALPSGTNIVLSKKVPSFPVTLSLPDTLGFIVLEATGKAVVPDAEYELNISSPNNVAQGLAGALSVSQTSKSSSALKMEIAINNVDKGNAILVELVRQYNIQNNKANNEISYNTALFINERLKEIATELGDVESDMVNYKQQNKIADLPSEAQLSIQQSGQNYQKLMDAETQLSIINMVDRFVKDPANDMKVIPNLGVSDPALASIIGDYNLKVVASETLLKNTGVENPTRAKVVDEVRSMHSAIVNSLGNVKQAYRIAKTDAEKLLGVSNTQIHAIPQQEKGLLERARQQQIKENLFLFLMQKREETNISIASISEKAKIVISPRKGVVPIAPNTKMILLVSFLVGLLIPILAIYILGLLQTEVADRGELERLSTVSVIGQIPFSPDFLALVADPSSSVSELLRTLRNRLDFIFQNKEHKVVLVTSSLKGEGKTFVSINMAMMYAFTGKKVLLVGGDIRRPQLKKLLNLRASEGLSDYLACVNDDWKSYIVQPPNFPELDIIISGTVPPNPNELLMSPRLRTFFEDARKEYDIVVVDSAPVGMVSDTYLYSDFVDVTLYIVRENVTPKTAIQFVNSQKKEGTLKNMYLVLNDSEISQHYGYKYGYGKGYGYSEEQDKKKTFFKKR